MDYITINVDDGTTEKAGGHIYVTDNFLFDEIACNDGSDVILYSKRLMGLIQAIRDIVGPLTINSAFRTPSHNAKVGGVDTSYHQHGVAVDMKTPSGMTSKQFAEIVEKVAGTECAIGTYDTFVHLDIGHIARW